GLERLFPARRNASTLQDARRMATSPSPNAPPETLETRTENLPRASRPRPLGRGCSQGGGRRPALVEKLGDASQQGPLDPLLRPARRPPAGRVTSTLRTARCGPACRVVWQGSPEIIRGPYADPIKLP